jgi:prephenate dehydrogenase
MGSDAPFQSIAIVGFGLIGASIAAALRQRHVGVKLSAADVDPVISEVSKLNLVHACVSVSDAAALRNMLGSSELTILAAPVGVIEHLLPDGLANAKLITDCGSTKRSICDVASRAPGNERFVPGHPMAGKPTGGYFQADADLFEGRKWFLCDDVGSSESHRAVARFVRAIGAEPVTLSAAEHDAAVALTSHLPQLLASLLVSMNATAGASVAAGPGFESATRVAGGDERMWSDIFRTNPDEIARVARALGVSLTALADDLDQRSVESSMAALRAARALRST